MAFRNWLMSDGYWAYRDIDQRLRCLAHLIRKAHGLEESFDRRTSASAPRPEGPRDGHRSGLRRPRWRTAAGGLRERHAPLLNALLDACLRQANARA